MLDESQVSVNITMSALHKSRTELSLSRLEITLLILVKTIETFPHTERCSLPPSEC